MVAEQSNIMKWRVPYYNSYYPTDRFLGTQHAHKFLEASDRSLTTPMHTDRQELIGCDAEVVCGG